MKNNFSIFTYALLAAVVTFQSCKKDDDGMPQETVAIKKLTQQPIAIVPSTYSIDGTAAQEIDFIAITDAEGFDSPLFQLQDTSENTNLFVSLNDDFLPDGALVFYSQGSVTFTGNNLTSQTVTNGFRITGPVETEDGSQTKQIDLTVTETQAGAGVSTLNVTGTKAVLTGVLGTNAYNQILDLNAKHPEVNTLVFDEIDGSVNDEVNVETGRLIREAGYTTSLLSTSDIASGGVDLFVSGKKRTMEGGAKIGVHSWCCFEGKPASELPMDSQAHDSQLSYFTEMLGEAIGRDFYFFTLQAAPFDGIHYMTAQEIAKYDIVTE